MEPVQISFHPGFSTGSSLIETLVALALFSLATTGALRIHWLVHDSILKDQAHTRNVLLSVDLREEGLVLARSAPHKQH